MLKPTSNVKPLYSNVDYCRFSGFVAGGYDYNAYQFDIRGAGVIIDGCAVADVQFIAPGTASASLYCFFLWQETCVLRNCMVYDIELTNSGGYSATIIGIYCNGATDSPMFLFNNAVHELHATSDTGTASVYGVYFTNTQNGDAINNVFGTITCTSAGTKYPRNFHSGGQGGYDMRYNAATADTPNSYLGADSQYPITAANEFTDTDNLRIKAGGDCESNGYNLLYHGYANAPTEDIDGTAYPSAGTWDMGANIV